MIDSHCHLDLPAFDDDWLTQVALAKQVGVNGFLIPATHPERWQKQLKQRAIEPSIWVALGIHPWFIDNRYRQMLEQLPQFLESNDALAIGEIGLDAACDIDPKVQQDCFETLLSIASSHRLPVILHHRKTHNELIRTLKQQRFTLGGILHGFSGSEAIAKQYLDLGFKLGVGGTITYPRANKTRLAVKSVGLDGLVLETDSPDMPVLGYQGQRNTPTKLPIIAEALANLCAESIDKVDQQTTANFKKIMKLS